MLVIRLQRTGRKNLPSYRVVVAEKARPAKGKFLEIVGHYLPAREPANVTFDEERITHWVTKGAVPSDTVARLLSRQGVKGLEKFVVPYAKRKPRQAEAEAASAQADAKPDTAQKPASAAGEDGGKDSSADTPTKEQDTAAKEPQNPQENEDSKADDKTEKGD